MFKCSALAFGLAFLLLLSPRDNIRFYARSPPVGRTCVAHISYPPHGIYMIVLSCIRTWTRADRRAGLHTACKADPGFFGALFVMDSCHAELDMSPTEWPIVYKVALSAGDRVRAEALSGSACMPPFFRYDNTG